MYVGTDGWIWLSDTCWHRSFDYNFIGDAELYWWSGSVILSALKLHTIFGGMKAITDYVSRSETQFQIIVPQIVGGVSVAIPNNGTPICGGGCDLQVECSFKYHWPSIFLFEKFITEPLPSLTAWNLPPTKIWGGLSSHKIKNCAPMSVFVTQTQREDNVDDVISQNSHCNNLILDIGESNVPMVANTVKKMVQMTLFGSMVEKIAMKIGNVKVRGHHRRKSKSAKLTVNKKRKVKCFDIQATKPKKRHQKTKQYHWLRDML